MANINEILARAAALRDETALNSIDPERAGGIMYDTLIALNELWLQKGVGVVFSKIYSSVSAMQADTNPVSDLTGQPLRPGQMVVIVSSDSDNGSVYRYNGTTTPNWSLVGNVGNVGDVMELNEKVGQLLELKKLANDKNLLLFSHRIDNKYYYQSPVASDSYCYFIIPVVSGQSYIISQGARFISKDGVNIVNDVMVNYTYTADFTGNLYVTYHYETQTPWIVCLASDDMSLIGGYNTPSLSENIISQEYGNSKTKVVSQDCFTKKVKLLDVISKKSPGSIILSSSQLSGDVLVTTAFSIKSDYNIIASFEASNITQVLIGKGYYNRNFGSYLSITPAKWSVYVNDVEQTVLRDVGYELRPQFFKVYIKVGNNHKAKINISYPGDNYVYNDIPWEADGRNEAFIYSGTTDISNVLFSFSMRKSARNIYMFGDSYFGIDNSTTWVYDYLQEYNNALISGFGGAKTEDAYRSLDNLLTLNTPRYCILCTGMNDGNDGSTSPSQAWTTWKDYFINKCLQYGVEPILSTVPTVPSINNEKKNEWVRGSGYRYIDFAKAVGSNASGQWYNNMLSSDQIHPTSRGAQALFYQAIVDVPELIFD